MHRPTRLGRGASSFWGQLGLIGVVSVLRNSLLVCVPIGILHDYNFVRQSRQPEYFLLLFGAIIVLLFGQAALRLLRIRLLRNLAGTFDQWCRHHSGFEKLAASSQRARDIGRVKHFIIGNGVASVFDVPWALVFLAILTRVSPWLGATSLMFSVAITIVASTEQRYRQRFERNFSPEPSLLNRSDSYKAFMTFSVATSLSGESQDKAFVSRLNVTRVGDFLRVALQALRSVHLMTLLGIVTYLSATHPGSVNAVVVTAFLANRISDSLETFVLSFQDISEARNSWRNIRRADDGAATLREAVRAATPIDNFDFCISHLSVIHADSGAPILSDATLRLTTGDILMIVADNGSGKTLVANTLAGCQAPHAGQLLFDNIDRESLADESIIEAVGYVPQEIKFYPGTIADNVSGFSRSINSAAVENALNKIALQSFIAKLKNGADTKLSEVTDQLSPGIRQKLGIARAMYNIPHLLIFDEPFSYLDDEGSERLVNALREHQLSGGIAIIFAAKAMTLPLVSKVGSIKGNKIEVVNLLEVRIERTRCAGVAAPPVREGR
jgi:ABC-type protease/lipase transport system fused ATPase/permease subunit